MSLHEYKVSQHISAQDHPFYALLMACFRKADSDNLEKLRRAYPETWHEFQERHHAPGGRLDEELLEQAVEELPKTILGRTVVVKEAGPRHLKLALGPFDSYNYTHKRPEPDTLPPTRRPKQEDPDGA